MLHNFNREPIKRSRPRLPIAIGTVISLVLIAGLVGGVVLWQNRSGTDGKGTKTSAQKSGSSGVANPGNESSVAASPDKIRVLLAGDFIAHDSINTQAKQSDGSYNYMPMMKDFTDVFRAADIRFCNDANLTAGPAFGISGYPKFNAPTEFVRDMGKVGCNMVNVGTNHSFDRNQEAINASIDAWDTVPGTLAVVGHNRNQAEHDKVRYFTVKGVKFAFLAYTTYLNAGAPAQNNYGVNVYSNEFAARQIATAKENGAQIIIASVRWGVEYSGDVSASQKQVAQFLADKGVSLIIGHGSHVLEPVEQLTGANGSKSTVWYSIGNFLNTQIPAETLFNGLGVVDFDVKTRQITKMGFLPLYNHYEWTAAQASAETLSARHDVRMYLLEKVTQPMIDAQQLRTTVAAQKARMQTTLSKFAQVPLITSQEYYSGD